MSNCQITGLDDHRWGVNATIITDKATLLLCIKQKKNAVVLFDCVFLFP